MESREAVLAAIDAAAELGGVVSGTSAALLWGWDVKWTPPKPMVTVPRHRRLNRNDRDKAAVRFLDLPPGDVVEFVTTPIRTVLDVARRMPFDEGLVVADSALRHGMEPEFLRRSAQAALGPGVFRMRQVALHADARAANAFESCLRSIALSVRGLNVTPQMDIWDPEFLGRPDLVDRDLRIVIEADSFRWHGGRDALRADARRYDLFVVNGWLVLRFAWEDVMYDPGWVRVVLEAVVADRMGQK